MKNNFMKKTISLLACFGLAPVSLANQSTTLEIETETPVNVEQALRDYRNCFSKPINVDIERLLDADSSAINIAIADITGTQVGTITTEELTTNNTVPVKPHCLEQLNLSNDLLDEIIIRDLTHGRDVDSTGMCMRIRE